MKIIFLDIDGVLVLTRDAVSKVIEQPKAQNILYYGFGPKRVEFLKKIFDSVEDVKIVVISTWAAYFNSIELDKIFENEGVEGKIIDVIGHNGYASISSSGKADFVKYYVQNNKIKNYVVIDDQELYVKNLVKVDKKMGLTLGDVELAIHILNKRIEHEFIEACRLCGNLTYREDKPDCQSIVSGAGIGPLCENCLHVMERHEKLMHNMGMVYMPKALGTECGHKTLLSGEFKESVDVVCPNCCGEHELCETCNREGVCSQDVDISWTTIKKIYKKIVDFEKGKK